MLWSSSDSENDEDGYRSRDEENTGDEGGTGEGEDDVEHQVEELLKRERRPRPIFFKSTLFDENLAFPGFEYVVKKKVKPKVAFLSGQRRALVVGRPEFNRLACDRPQPDAFSASLSPGTYDSMRVTGALYKLANQVTSKVGVGGLARREKRSFPVKPPESGDALGLPPAVMFPSEGRKGTEVLRWAKRPFGRHSPRFKPMMDITPGVSTYDVRYVEKDHRVPFKHSFGGRVRMKHCVDVRCTPINTDACERCARKPGAADYWTSSEGFHYCHPCYTKYIMPTLKDAATHPQQATYRKTRDCSFMHQHEGTTAALPLMSARDYRKQCIRENYFYTYTVYSNLRKVPPKGKKHLYKRHLPRSHSRVDKFYMETSKFLSSLYEEPEAIALRRRNITDYQLADLFRPMSLVPDPESLATAYLDVEEGEGEQIEEMEEGAVEVEERVEEEEEEGLMEEKEEELKKEREKKDAFKWSPSVAEAAELADILYQEYSSDVSLKFSLKEEVVEETTQPPPRTGWSDLDLLQDPDIPPLPRALGPNEERLEKSRIDPDIISLLTESQHPHSVDPNRQSVEVRPSQLSNIDVNESSFL